MGNQFREKIIHVIVHADVPITSGLRDDCVEDYAVDYAASPGRPARRAKKLSGYLWTGLSQTAVLGVRSGINWERTKPMQTKDMAAIWSQVLRQLKAELPPAWYSGYVEPTRAVVWEEGVMTVAAASQSAQEWLENRLGSTAGRILTGLAARPMRVRFEVQEEEQELQVFASSAAERDDEEVVWEEARAALKEALLEPAKVITFPKYLLRWLPLVGAQVLWMVIAFRQARFLATTPHTREKYFAARAQDVYCWCGMPRASFWRKLDHPHLAWFMERERVGARVEKTGVNRYCIPVEAALTPMDAQRLGERLRQERIQDDPLSALNQVLAEAENGKLLVTPAPSPTQAQIEMVPRILTVSGVVAECLRSVTIQESSRPQVTALSEKLCERIVRPREVVTLSWYFLKKWLSVLGPDAAMLVVLLRSQVYRNLQSGEERNQVWIAGGHAEIARQLGLSNPRRIVNWLPPLPKSRSRETRNRTSLAQFIHRVGTQRSAEGRLETCFHVRLEDGPLSREDQGWYDILIQLLERARAEGVLGELKAWLETEQVAQDSERLPKSQERSPVLRLAQAQDTQNETLTRVLDACFETRSKAPSPDLRRLLKYLKNSTLINPVLKKTTTHEARMSKKEVVEAWDLDQLLRHNRVDSQIRTRLLERESGGQAFVSWVIYGAAQPKITDPVGLALKKLLAQPGMGAGAQFEHLAEVGAEELANKLRDARGQGKLFKTGGSERIRLIQSILNIAEEQDE